ncbi:hypothetical protein [Couchioplanes caeruleus]|uniref:Uncharacterized protein n=2 Tax=Couchioplanes caeruleus TaxID=56438 RepID=A0A1K0FLF3_9ACTN|nr:hypothetical protein [Couchioplanes caeruleus]OJF13560.1 hypothetical protein BG844_14540 [Couchioplanes caeruleus subsp. caeruleus]ROP34164.1 hypothetical protein EDD30_7241 [Couchioplanes caeruleus]
MGFLERRTRADDRYGTKPGPASSGSNEPLYAPRLHPDPRPSTPPPVPPVSEPREEVRSDLTLVLGHSVLEDRVQQICREYGLVSPSGVTMGAALSRSYLARESGVELAADAHGMVTTVFLHFHGDDGFIAYRGEIPGGAGTIPQRTALWERLGRPDEMGEPYHDRFLGDYGPWDRWMLPGFHLHAQFTPDGETLARITLTPPGR